MNAHTDVSDAHSAGRDAATETGPRDDFTVSEPREIARVLRQLADARGLLQVQLADGGESYSSALLAVESEPDPVLCLDELIPEEGHRRVQAGTWLHVHGRLSGVPLQFVSRVVDVGTENGVAIYRTALPPKLGYRQRRADFRAMVGLGRPVIVRLRNGDGGEAFQGALHDISIGGMALRLDPRTAQRIEASGASPLQCETTLPSGFDLHCQVEVRHSHPTTPRSDGYILGVCFFTGLDRSARIAVQRYIADLEREMLRTRPRT